MEVMVDAALAVPTINKRTRISVAAINSVVEQITRKFHPQRMVLFGSYAWGKPRPESDVDLLVVMDTPLREAEQATQICQQIDYLFPHSIYLHLFQILTQSGRLEQSSPDYYRDWPVILYAIIRLLSEQQHGRNSTYAKYSTCFTH